MKKIIKIKLMVDLDSEYEIVIGTGLLNKQDELKNLIGASKYSSIFVLMDENVAKLREQWMAIPTDWKQIVVPAGEQHKNIDTVQKIWAGLLAGGADRKSLLINLGGGVVGDMGGFAAATYMRGIAFVQVPTTLLSQVDASVGGKLGVDFGGMKNIVGTFVNPQMVIIDPEVLNTLPEKQLISGFAEVLKHGLIADPLYFDKVCKKLPRDFSSEELVEIIRGSCEIKATVVRQDPKELGLRKILNFGHTVGHAVESLSYETGRVPLLHGEAVAIGMMAEATLAKQLGMLSANDVAIIRSKIVYMGLPIKPDFAIDPAKFWQLVRSDKKNAAGKVKWVLLKKIGEAVWDIETTKELNFEDLLA